MKYFNNSVVRYIGKIVEKIKTNHEKGHRILVTIPTIPERNLIILAEALTSRYIMDSDVKLILKVASFLTENWTEVNQEKAQEQDWIDEVGQLTYYRNLPVQKDKFSLIILCGADKVTDSASLSDFHSCDLDSIWKDEMKKSFKGWMTTKLQDTVCDSLEDEKLNSFNRILKPLLDSGRTDLMRISDWLEILDLSEASDLSEIYAIVLRNLQEFGLPSFSSFPIKRKSFAKYIEKAELFFNYSLFLEPKERDKAQKAIETILNNVKEENDIGFTIEEENSIGLYASVDEFLSGLKNYVLTDDKDDRDKLLRCDFVMIADKIIKYKEKTEPKRTKISVKKLSGSPVEVILTAIWATLHDFYANKDNKYNAKLCGIKIEAEKFKYNIEEVEDFEQDSDSVTDNKKLALEYLNRLIGGIDNIVQEQLSLSHGEENKIEVICALTGEKITCVHSSTAEPQLEFSVYINYEGSEEPFRSKFALRLPENHSYRLAEALLWRTSESLRSAALYCLPVFHLPYFDELMGVSGEEEVRRIFLHCVRDARMDSSFMTNLLSPVWREEDDDLLGKLDCLSAKYKFFIEEAANYGLLRALFVGKDKWIDLRRSYLEAYKEAANSSCGSASEKAAMLLRAFLVISKRPESFGHEWYVNKYEPSGVVTVLHPALLEMLEAQILYQFTCFNYAVKKALTENPDKKNFKPQIWRTYLDLSQINLPLPGLLRDRNKVLDTNVRGEELIHRMGLSQSGDGAVSTRLFINQNEGLVDDENFSDTEMFRITSESRLLWRLMLDYFSVHPHAADGISIAVYRNKDVQPVIAAVHHYLSSLANEKEQKFFVINGKRRRPYSISVTFFTESGDYTDVSRWIEQWKERWEAAETDNKYSLYKECCFSVAHRLIDAGQKQSFRDIINNNFEADIAVFYDFIGSGGGTNDFGTVEPFNVTQRSLKFPILEKACCAVKLFSVKNCRTRIISNRQFSLGSQHATLLHFLQSGSPQVGTVVIGERRFDDEWQKIINDLHNKVEWVICVDSNMDDRLIRKETDGSPGTAREIIGFGSGVGSHGEYNYTISTEQMTLSDISVRLRESIKSLYSHSKWTDEDYCAITTGVLQEACTLSGISLVRAAGVRDKYIHDFMAYALSRKMLRTENEVLCDNMVSLDAYRHWFDLSETKEHPDLMWLTVTLGEDKRLHLNIRLIECKMASQSDDYLLKAQRQINCGLNVLVPSFEPDCSSSNEIDDERPDKRYWWMQLHRLIASKTEVKSSQKNSVLFALERLSEGDYEINWGAAVFAFWLDSESSDIKFTGKWMAGPGERVEASICEMGCDFVKKLATGNESFPFSWEKLSKENFPVNRNVCDELANTELADVEIEEDELDYDEDLFDDFDDEESEDEQPILYYDEPDGKTTIKLAEKSLSEEQNLNDEAERPQNIVELSDTNIPDRILIGESSIGKPVYWEFGHSELSNRHMVILGTSGMGKTYAIQCLLCELARAGQNSLILDYTDGFLPSKLEPSAKAFIKDEAQNFVIKNPLTINPFKAQVSYEGGMEFRDDPNTISKRVAAIFKNVYDLGVQQFSALVNAISEGLKADGDNFDLDKLLIQLKNLLENSIYQKISVQSTITKLSPFITGRPFVTGSGSDIGWSEIFENKDFLSRVFQFHKMDAQSARVLIEFVMWDLYSFTTSHGNVNLPKVLVLDEVQNLDQDSDAPLAKYLTEGRKHGLSLILATQTVKGIGSVNGPNVSRLFQAAQKIFFRPTENEMQENARLLNMAVSSTPVSEWAHRLSLLQKGECWVLGPTLNEQNNKLSNQAKKVKITSLEERGFHG